MPDPPQHSAVQALTIGESLIFILKIFFIVNGMDHNTSSSHDGEKKEMGLRGVTRPMEMESNGDGSGKMAPRFQRQQMLEKHHAKTSWIYWTIFILGFWMLLAPLTFSYFGEAAQLPGGRTVWIAAETRSLVFFWNDILCGLALIVLGWRSLKSNRPLTLWIACGIGVWLNLAPILFWAPQAFIYMNESLVGTLLIALTILIPGMPNMLNYMAMGPDRPGGWSYNPSSWIQRSIMIALGFAGWMVSRYLAAYQLGYIDSVWDPFFGPASAAVLTSKMSESWPVSDAGLGAFSYTFEFLMGWMGASSRWRTMPWMVTFFGILVIPLGLVHIALVISQPLVVGHWCFMCLLAAAIMLPMIPLEADEVVAMGQFLYQAKQKGRNLWQSFWLGGPSEGAVQDEQKLHIHQLHDHPRKIFLASLSGMSFPLLLVLTTILGIFFMSFPGWTGMAKSLADQQHLVGAIVVVLSGMAMGEPLRAFRFLNIPAGLWLALTPFWVSGTNGFVIIISLLTGLLIAAASFPRGQIKHRYGSWNRFIV